MGVTSLWDIVGPTARPVKLESLSRKRLAVDASIWIYQFLKAVRDKDGNSLSQSHIVGFFRRICKLLYYGIYPIFVFDGGAPVLKKRVIQQRIERRQENQQDATMTAQRLLAIQLQSGTRQNHSNSKKKKRALAEESNQTESDIKYLEDMPILHPDHHASQNPSAQLISSAESSPNKKFIKKDDYHLPDIKQFKVSKNDNRIMPATEFQELTEDADFGIVDGIDIDTADPSSKEFAALPLATQYMILSHLRLRSRLRLGYTKDQLEVLFPNSKDFSRFQIEQVKKRNYYTQKLMTVSGMSEDSGNITRRIAGDKDRHYTLIKNDDGWTLSLEDDNGDLIELDESGNVSKSLNSPLKENVDDFPSSEKKTASFLGDPSSDSDEDLIDVEVDRRPGDGVEADKAIIESIYDMYKAPEQGEAKSADTATRDLKLAVEKSKKLYMEQKKEEEQSFDLQLSVLFDGHSSEGLSQHQNELKEITSLDSQSEEDHTEAIEKERNISKPVPNWFKQDVSHVDKIHLGDQFFSDREVGPQPDKDEEAGLISWSQAKDLIQKRGSAVLVSDGLDSDLEVVEHTEKEAENPDKSSEQDVENRELHPPSTKPKILGIESDNDPNVVEKKAFLRSDADLPTETQSQRKIKPLVFDYEVEEAEEESLLQQLREEDDHHAEFTSEMKSKQPIPVFASTRITDEQLYQERLQKAKRDSDEVSQTMISDVQELLRRFGIPFITAPMEAEAQCAELYRLGLVDGIITDDSDCFLFGGSRIYKNMFNQKQYVECYFEEEIEHKLGLSQERLIELALLLGSDYTEGIKGIGPVLAMEILAEFGNLKTFKQWFDEHARELRKSDNAETPIKRNLLSRLKKGKLFLPSNFPDKIVFRAYTHPDVDRDKTEFKWGVPNLDQIRSFLMYNVGWSQSKVDEVMLPLIRDMNKKRAQGTQSTLGEFFPRELIAYKKETTLGKRMKIAADRLHQNKMK